GDPGDDFVELLRNAAKLMPCGDKSGKLANSSHQTLAGQRLIPRRAGSKICSVFAALASCGVRIGLSGAERRSSLTRRRQAVNSQRARHQRKQISLPEASSKIPDAPDAPDR